MAEVSSNAKFVSPQPLVSIAMPVFNAERTITAAIRSILVQTYPNWELIIADDGSTDKSLQIAQSFADTRIRIISNGQHQGIVAMLNQAVCASRGEYIARMDSDDISYPQRIKSQLSYLAHNPNIDLVGSHVLVFGSGGRPLGKRNPPERHDKICSKPIAGFPIPHPTYLGKADWFHRNKYREEAVRCEDQDLLLRSYRFSQFAVFPEILLGYREENINLKKSIRGRYYFSKIICHEFGKTPFLSTRGVVEQTIKGMVDCFAVGTGFGHKLLRHRARPISDKQRDAWEKLWKLVNQTDQPTL
jgi:glycosyltransferase involved in cell wall biosynthesis